jgi:hypothetical protein
MFTRGGSLHYVQLPTAHVRFNSERQISNQIVAPRSKSLGFPEKAALAFRTHAQAA